MMSNGLVSENKLRNGSRVRGRGKSTDLVSCKQRHDLVCAQLRIIRGNPLANTFLLFISSFSLSFFPIFSFLLFLLQNDHNLFNVSCTNIFIILLRFQTHYHSPFFLLLFCEIKQFCLSSFSNLSNHRPFDGWFYSTTGG